MKFSAPQWLWVLIGVVIVFFLLKWDDQKRKQLFSRFIAPNLWPRLIPDYDPKARLRRTFLWSLGLLFMILALARPQWGFHEEVSRAQGLDLMIALDISNSMNTEDVVPSRIKKAKRIIKSLSEQLAGDRLGLVLFAGSAYVASPLTTDLDYFNRVLDSIETASIQNQGTDIGTGLEVARAALDRGAEEAMPSTREAHGSSVLLLISDGENHEEAAAEAAKEIAKNKIRFYVVGVGTLKGAPIPIRDDSGSLRGYKKDRKGQTVTSTFRPEALQGLAKNGDGKFWNVGETEVEVNQILTEMTGLKRGEFEERRVIVYEERFQIPLLLALICFFVEWLIPLRRVQPLYRDKSMMAILGASLLFVFSAEQTFAQSPPVGSFIENEKGLKALKEGKLDEAKEHFNRAQAIDPTLPELQFNQGVIKLLEGDTENASKAFSESGHDPHLNPALKGAATYNEGIAHGLKGNIPEAVRAFAESITLAKQAKDSKLEADARKNLELLIQKQEQDKNQKKQDQSKEQDKDQSKQNQQGQGNNQNDSQNQDPSKKDKNEDQGQSQPKQYQQSQSAQQKQKFQSKKLSEEDVERVMSELSNRERELQMRLKRRKGGSNGHVEKDW